MQECRKKAYLSAEAAIRAHAGHRRGSNRKKRRHGAGNQRLRAYLCPNCHKYHVTNPEK
jgi:hypothetical protein